METTQIAKEIEGTSCVLGIELGSTRIKAALINSAYEPVANGSFEWESVLSDGIWTYPLDLIFAGLKACYADLKRDVKQKYGVTLKRLKALGISAMMHGYLAFDKGGTLLVPFRTWQNTITHDAASELTKLFNFPIPERWSISHLYHAILQNEPHVKDLACVFTLAAYIHYKLTGQRVVGIGDASGMFPIDSNAKDYNETFLSQFDSLIADRHFPWKTRDLFPRVLCAGEDAGALTREGARLLDADGDLEGGCPVCPPEGDAGTGMTATNSVRPRTGNISAGTSVFAMVVLERSIASYPGIIDLVTTPDGLPVAMVHANNCTSELNSWISLFGEVAKKCGGSSTGKDAMFDAMISESLKADKDTGGLLAYNYHSGETITGFNSGRPLFVRAENASFTLANFMRVQMFAALGALRCGMDVLFEKENVKIDSMTGAGGYFKSEAGLKYMAAAMHTPINAMETAGEGGPWGMAILAAYAAESGGRALPAYLDDVVFAHSRKTTTASDPALEESFNIFYKRYSDGLPIERAATENI